MSDTLITKEITRVLGVPCQGPHFSRSQGHRPIYLFLILSQQYSTRKRTKLKEKQEIDSYFSFLRVRKLMLREPYLVSSYLK